MRNSKLTKQILLLIIVLTISSHYITRIATAVEQQQTIQNKPYIDPQLHLTKKHLPMLLITHVHIKNIQIKTFIAQIIKKIILQGSIEKQDIESIIKQQKLETEIKGIYFLCWVRSDGIGYLITRGMLSLIFMLLFEDFIMDEVFLGPTAYVEWNSPRADTKINLRKLYDDDRQSGYIVGFIGYSYTAGIWPVIYSVIGMSLLVIITDYEY